MGDEKSETEEGRGTEMQSCINKVSPYSLPSCFPFFFEGCARVLCDLGNSTSVFIYYLYLLCPPRISTLEALFLV